MRRVAFLFVWLCAVGTGATSWAQSAANVAVVINETDAASRTVGEYYVAQRGVPASNVIRLRTTSDDTIERAAFVSTIQQPIALALARENLVDRVLYLVLTKGVPLRIAGTGGPNGTVASVDSELTLLYRAMLGQPALARGRIENPYFLGSAPVQNARPFSHRAHDIFLVSRIDGFTVEDARALVDRAKTPTSEGRIVLDQRAVPAAKVGDSWLAAAAQRLSSGGQGARVLLESSADAVREVRPVLGYYSWGSSDPRHRERNPGLGFVPGAIAATFVSTDARTFREPPATWQPTGNTVAGTGLFAGSPHSLIGDLIRGGVTGVAGQVSEPYLESVVRPDILFAAYVAGFNLIESFYLALPHLSWQSIVVGDPLCAPFPRTGPPAADLDPDIDAQTTLPAFFSARRMQILSEQAPGMSAPAVNAWARATAAMTREDHAAAKSALLEATKLAPKSAPPRVLLALLYEGDKEYQLATEQYQQILAIEPNNTLTLNNLAYSIAVRQGRPKDALPYAQRAAALAPSAGTVLDTLAWIEHLLGDDVSASRRLVEAVRREPQSAEIRLHAAIVHAANAAKALAETELNEALRLDPSLEGTEEVKALRAKLAALAPG